MYCIHTELRRFCSHLKFLHSIYFAGGSQRFVRFMQSSFILSTIFGDRDGCMCSYRLKARGNNKSSTQHAGINSIGVMILSILPAEQRCKNLRCTHRQGQPHGQREDEQVWVAAGLARVLMYRVRARKQYKEQERGLQKTKGKADVQTAHRIDIVAARNED